jgi:hypothetical protein
VRMVWIPSRRRRVARVQPLRVAAPWISKLCDRRYQPCVQSVIDGALPSAMR